MPKKNESEECPITALEYLENQVELEREARQAMPYDPEDCSYPEPLRQLVYACLTCLKANNNQPVGVCYLCLIQCHGSHELVELFPKRSFVCDCGTTRIKNGHACELRLKKARSESRRNSQQLIPRLRTGFDLHQIHSTSHLDLPAEDIPGNSNAYNHNYAGRFCDCDLLYNPMKETITMHQCFFGECCGEDWFHQDCIMGYKPGLFRNNSYQPGINKLELLPSPGLDAEHDNERKLQLSFSESTENEQSSKVDLHDDTTQTSNSNTNDVNESSQREITSDTEDETVPHFPPLDSFSEFICWRCVDLFREAFDQLCDNPKVVQAKLPHFQNVSSAEEWEKLNKEFLESQPQRKKLKAPVGQKQAYSVLLCDNFKGELENLKNTVEHNSPVGALLRTYNFFWDEDKVYRPPEENNGISSSTGSLYDMGAEALQSLPGNQAIEGLHAYGLMRTRLRDFFQGFVDKNKVVTENEVRDFFGKMKNLQHQR